MDIDEINLNQVKNDELLDIYKSTTEFIAYLENELKSDEVRK